MGDEVAAAISELRDVIEIQTAGLMKMLGIQAQQSAMLKEILTACSAEPDGPSPLVDALKQLISAVGGQTAAIARIEAAIVQAR